MEELYVYQSNVGAAQRVMVHPRREMNGGTEASRANMLCLSINESRFSDHAPVSLSTTALEPRSLPITPSPLDPP